MSSLNSTLLLITAVAAACVIAPTIGMTQSPENTPPAAQDTSPAVQAEAEAEATIAPERPAWLGITMRPLTAPLAERLRSHLHAGQGVLVADMTPDGPAATGGLKPGDVLATYDLDGPQILLTIPQLQLLVAADTPGREVELHVLRDGQPLVVPVRLGTAPSPEQQDEATATTRRPSVTTSLSLSTRWGNAAITSADGVRYRVNLTWRDRSGRAQRQTLTGTLRTIIPQLYSSGIPQGLAEDVHLRLRRQEQPRPLHDDGWDGASVRSDAWGGVARSGSFATSRSGSWGWGGTTRSYGRAFPGDTADGLYHDLLWQPDGSATTESFRSRGSASTRSHGATRTTSPSSGVANPPTAPQQP